MTESVWNERVRRLMALDLPRATAERYAGLIGDTPTIVGDEVVILEEDGLESTEVARVPVSVIQPEGGNDE